MSFAREAPLTWGQRHTWLNHYRLAPGARQELNIVARYEPPRGATAQSLGLALNYLVRRHESLRTTYHRDPVVQRVDVPARLPVACVETAGSAPVQVNTLSVEFSTREFDLERDWPIRACVLTTGAVPTMMIVVLHLIAVDDWSIEQLRRELEHVHAHILARRPIALPPVDLQPAELADVEQSVAVEGIRRSALGYWKRSLAIGPADPFGCRRTIPPPAEPTAFSASLSSPACLKAARQLASRYQEWPSTIHLAALVTALREYSGHRTITCRLYGPNRDSEAYRSVLTTLFLPVPMSVDCADDPTFGELVRRVAQRSEESLEHSYFPHDEALEIVARQSGHQGKQIYTGMVFDFLNHTTRTAGIKRTVFVWNSTPAFWAQLGDDALFRLYQWQDCVVAALNAQSSVMTADAVEKLLRCFEAVVLTQESAVEDMRISELACAAGFEPPPSAAGGQAGHEISASSELRTEPVTDPEVALADAVRNQNQLSWVNMGQSYIASGGRMLNIPGVLHLLSSCGWSGPTFSALASIQPLITVASGIHRMRSELTWAG